MSCEGNNYSMMLRKNWKIKCLTGKEMLPSTQSRTIEQTKFMYSILGKADKSK